VPRELMLPPGGLPAVAPQPREKAAPPVREQRARPRESRSGNAERVVLVTGFDPFGGEPLNPSWEICRRLPREIAGLRVETCRVPCEFRRAIEVVAEAVERHRPAIVISLGQAGGRTHMSGERDRDQRGRCAHGRQCGHEADRRADRPQWPGGLFLDASHQGDDACDARGRRARGGLQHRGHLRLQSRDVWRAAFLVGSGNPARAGFIHVPYAAEQVAGKPGLASLSLETMVAGVSAAIAAAATQRQDLAVAEGKLD
jgi:Pyrrolidone-carboxylate peptidase (N-terminal pyroglutamyl peptidase)